MKNKKLLSTIVASALVTTTLGMPVMAAGDTIDVDVSTKTAVLRVAVPTTLVIAVDQLEMADKGTQISSAAFTMENKSAVDVKVKIDSTADLKSTTKLVATKDAAEKSTADGEAWLAVAAQTSAGSYVDGTADSIAKLTEANKNVTTFVQGTETNAEKGTASQTYYLGKAVAGYKLLNASEDKTNLPSYAQFYRLTAETTVTDQAKLDAMVAEKDLYDAPAAAANAQELTFIAKGSNATWTTGHVYYSVADTETAKDTVKTDTTSLYVYANGTAANDGAAAFRYIGKLSPKQDAWSDADITDVHITYDITGVMGSKYDEVKTECTYGLYADGPGVTMTTGGLITMRNVKASDIKTLVINDGSQNYEMNSTRGTWTTLSDESKNQVFQLGDAWVDFIKGKTNKVTLTLKDGKQYNTTVTVPAA